MSIDWHAIVHGCAALEPGEAGGVVPQRLPAWARAQVADPMFRLVASCPTGVALRFDTAASAARLTMTATTVAAPGVAPARPQLIVRRGETETAVEGPAPSVILVDAAQQIIGHETQPAQTIDLPLPGTGTATVFLPHDVRVELISLDSDLPVTPVSTHGVRWTHYGSSISQGLNAVSAVRTWPVAAAIQLGWQLHNLSFAGNAQLDGFAARVIRDTPSDLITLKIGINLINADSMRERTFRPAVHAFLDTIREEQPETPIVLISAISCPIHEESAGPTMTAADGLAGAAPRGIEQDAGALMLRRTREILAEIVAARDEQNLTLLDGRELFSESDAHLLYDRLHPNQEGLDLIAERFVERIGRSRTYFNPDRTNASTT